MLTCDDNKTCFISVLLTMNEQLKLIINKIELFDLRTEQKNGYEKRMTVHRTTSKRKMSLFDSFSFFVFQLEEE